MNIYIFLVCIRNRIVILPSWSLNSNLPQTQKIMLKLSLIRIIRLFSLTSYLTCANNKYYNIWLLLLIEFIIYFAGQVGLKFLLFLSFNWSLRLWCNYYMTISKKMYYISYTNELMSFETKCHWVWVWIWLVWYYNYNFNSSFAHCR